MNVVAEPHGGEGAAGVLCPGAAGRVVWTRATVPYLRGASTASGVVATAVTRSVVVCSYAARKALVAQWIEHRSPKAGAAGSNPAGGALPDQRCHHSTPAPHLTRGTVRGTESA